MDKIKKIILFRIPMSICNFRCHYCYIAQRPIHFEGIQPEKKYSPEQIAAAFSPKRLGGLAYMNFCADGETLLVKDIDKYIYPLAKVGHYIEIVTNLTLTSVLNKFLSWDKSILKHITFKCSFHYLELKKRGMLNLFAENVKAIWSAGSSANIEITPSDELVPYIEEVKEFSIKHFGALPHLTIARDDRTKGIEYLTKMSLDEYNKTWAQFGSGFWEFKKTIFKKKQTDFCYAGAWGMYVDLCSGTATQCYCGRSLGDIVADPNKNILEIPIGKCPISHCYNGHALMTLGYIPGYTTRYGDIRDREKEDGSHWIQPEMKAFLNSQLVDSNSEYSNFRKKQIIGKSYCRRVLSKSKYVLGKVLKK